MAEDARGGTAGGAGGEAGLGPVPSPVAAGMPVKGVRSAGGGFRLDSTRYRAVFDAKRSLSGRTVVAYVKRGSDAGRKAGVVVSKRTFHDAVDRNRAKRLMREAFRLSRAHLPADVEMVLIARGGIRGRKCADVMRDLEHLARRAGLWEG